MKTNFPELLLNENPSSKVTQLKANYFEIVLQDATLLRSLVKEFSTNVWNQKQQNIMRNLSNF